MFQSPVTSPQSPVTSPQWEQLTVFPPLPLSLSPPLPLTSPASDRDR
ncbi:hypothetical protein CKA32_004308 [Geitlerinema sp. FC II]|nr:hypothetical protein CKA32_004308 [Geitlerinema sp. FC II]